MSRRDPTSFRICRKTPTALAVAALCASLGACSTVPRDDGFGGAIADAGRTTAETASGLWDRTLYLLGFGEEAGSDGRPRSAEHARPRPAVVEGPRLLDEVDLALAKEDAVMPPSGAIDVVRSSAWVDTAAADDTVRGERADEGLDGARAVADSELTHEVGESETLWDIAKLTTGDATNWHVLADVNDLAPDAAVHPGQTLVVPADLVRPELVGFATTAEADAAAGAGARTLADAAATSGPELTEAETLAADVLAEVGAATGGTELRLAAGETLWDFAKRTTGDATNWRAIAEANDFSEEQATKVYENMRITVPTPLLRDEQEDVAEVADSPDVADTADIALGTGDEADGAPAPIGEASEVAAVGTETERPVAPAEADLAAAAGTDADAAGAGEDQPVRIVEAAYRTVPDDLVAERPTADASPEEIMVSGTYYPKAVYNEADFSSSLLMRVSPGTKLLVSRAVGPWYEVSTAQGTGYVHARDIK